MLTDNRRPNSFALFLTVTFLVAQLFVLPATAADQPTYTGRPSITDGDTIRIGDTRIRLHGIDTPEAKQTCQKQDGSVYRCGDLATFALAALIEEHWVTCKQTDKDKYGRVVAVCFTGPIDLNAEMVKSGWALAYRKYSQDYVENEALAKAARLGLWQGKFVKPWEWRRGKRISTTASKTGNVSGCQIKGNINSKGDHVYHLPNTRWYAQTVISVSKGEKWFCSEVDAAASGWRKAGSSTHTSSTPNFERSPANTQPAAKSCCRICREGKACGNSCVNNLYTCRKPDGCACDG